MRTRSLHWRELRRARREAEQAHLSWIRAWRTYSDLAVVFAGKPGVWGPTGIVGRAQTDAFDKADEYKALVARVRQLEGR